MSTVLDEALALREHGLALLPLAAGSKSPAVHVNRAIYGDTKTERFFRSRASAREVRAWVETDPTIGIGVICGDVSGGLVVIDVDDPTAFSDLKHPATPSVRTSRGRHIYTAAPAGTKSVTWPSGELRANGSKYVAAPPSRHPSGSTYEWECSFADVGGVLADLREVAGLPGLRTEGGLGSSSCLLPPPKEKDKRGKENWATDPASVRLMLRALGVDQRLGSAFRCVLPWHHDQRPSASVYAGDDGIFRYRCFSGCFGSEWLTLAEVFASVTAGELVRLRGPSQSRWYRRLAFDAGLVGADLPRLAQLPTDGEAVRKVAEGFQLLLALRALRDPHEAGIPFTATFGAPWCGVSAKQFEKARTKLSDADVIRPVGHTVIGGHKAVLWALGAGDLRRRQEAQARAAARRGQ